MFGHAVIRYFRGGKDVYRQRLRSSRTRSLAIDSTSFYARRMKAQLCRDSGDTLAAMAILEELYNGSDNPHEKASVAYNLARIHGSQGDDEARFDWLVRSAVHDFKMLRGRICLCMSWL